MLSVPILFCFIAGVLATSHCSHHSNNGGSSRSRASSSSSASSSAFASSSVKPSPPKCGPCPYIVVDPVDFHRMSGPWYEIERSSNNYDGSDRCYKLTWSKPVDNVSLLTYKSVSNLNSVTSTTVSSVSSNKQGTGFTYRFPSLGSIFKEHLILKTDYDSYAIVWSCEMHGKKRAEYAWTFARQQTAPCNIEAIKQQAFAKFNLTVPAMIKHDHSNCCEAFSSYDFCH